MKFHFTAIFLLSLFSLGQKKFNISDLELKNPKDFPFYLYMLEVGNEKEVYKSNYKHVDSLNFYGFDYQSPDDLTIRGFMVAPKRKGNFPVIVFNRGGNNNYGAITFGFMVEFLGRIANKGYIVIGSQLRGGTDSSNKDEFGGKEIQDVTALFDIINLLPNANKEDINMIGWSRGVLTNFQVLKKTNKINRCISIAGFADLSKTHRPEMFKVYRNCIPNYEKDSIGKLKQRSSLLAIDSIQNKNVKHFIVHGTKDERVKVENAYWLYDKLNDKKMPTKLQIYQNGTHGLEDETDDLCKKIVDFLKDLLN